MFRVELIINVTLKQKECKINGVWMFRVELIRDKVIKEFIYIACGEYMESTRMLTRKSGQEQEQDHERGQEQEQGQEQGQEQEQEQVQEQEQEQE